MDTTGIHTADEASGHITITGQGIAGEGRLPSLYAHAVSRSGGVPKVFSPFDELRPEENIPPGVEIQLGVDPDDLSPLDGAIGLLLPGGGDIDPLHYGAPRHPRTRRISRERDRLELSLLREALRRDLPVLAICRGFQLLNVCCGGTLEQHLADEASRIDHDRDMPRAEPVHTVRLDQDSMLSEVFEGEEIPVNSHHHQGLDRVADNLDKVGWAGDGVLEAVVAKDRTWVVGVQWHPEVMAPLDHRQMRLFEEFDAATRRYAAARSDRLVS